jgi:rfaE bifunctional protein nucleotidyltransferase chain/domain
MKKIVVNGTFDIIHPGHIQLLNYARGLGDYLLVVIDTDHRVKELKGDNRPINNQLERMLLLENLRAVDEVRFFNSDEQLEFILKDYEPDVMVKGSDYRNQPIIGAEYCRSIVFFDRIEQYSTTNKINQIQHAN